MRIKSTVWHWLAAGSLCAGLLCGMGLEGNAQVRSFFITPSVAVTV